MSSEEVWLPVGGQEGRYEVSSLGRVRSLSRIVPCRGGTRRITGRVLNPTPDRDGYPEVSMGKKFGKTASDKVHRLVLKAFRGPPNGLLSRHINGTRSDNRIANLAWGTHAENEADKVAHGHIISGEQHHNAKLNTEAVKVIRYFRGQESGVFLAAIHGVTPALISTVQLHNIWRTA